MKSLYIIFFSVFYLTGCQSDFKKPNAQEIIDQAIEVSGKEKFNNAEITFNFRDHKYFSQGTCSAFTFDRTEADSTQIIKDVFNPPSQLNRYINDSLVILPDSTANKYAESINSVMYFVQLPYRLNDNAVNKSFVGIDSLNGNTYYNIAVNFDQEGGGTDFEDEYLYWFNTENHKLDYLAYSFTVNDGGIRFREAYNERYIEGIRFVDYKNYKPKSEKLKLEDTFEAYKNGELELLSKIENKDIEVKLLDNDC